MSDVLEISANELDAVLAQPAQPRRDALKAAEQKYRQRIDDLATLQRKIARMSNSLDADPAELAQAEAEASALTRLMPNLRYDIDKRRSQAEAEASAQRYEAERPAVLRQRLANVLTERRLLNAEGQISTWQTNIRQLEGKDKALVQTIASLEAALQRLETGQG